MIIRPPTLGQIVGLMKLATQMTGSINIEGLRQDLARIANDSCADNVLKECRSLLALPPVQAVAGDQSEVVQERALMMLLRSVADNSENVTVKMAASFLLTHPGRNTKMLRVDEATKIPGARMSEHTLRRHYSELLSVFLGALLDFIAKPPVVRNFVLEARKRLGLSHETYERPILHAYYVHRDDYERRFKQLVTDGAKLIALVGQPGMGKTWLADSLMRQYQPSGSTTAWITMEPDGSPSLGDLYSALKACGLPISSLAIGDPRFHLHRLTRDEEHAPRFVVLDNLEDTATLLNLLPPEHETRSVVVATARRKTRLPEHCQIIDIGPMTDDEARRLVQRLLPDLDGDEADLLSQALHGFPLVTVFACRRIARKRVSVQEFCDALAQKPRAILSKVPVDATEDLVSVLTDIADQLAGHDEAAFELLECIVIVGTLSKFPECLLRRYFFSMNESRTIDDATTAVTYAMAVDSLLDFRLIEVVDNYYFAVHPLTRDVLRELLGDDFLRVAERVMARVIASGLSHYGEEIRGLQVRDDEYFFEHPIFYEVIDVWRLLALTKAVIGYDSIAPENADLDRANELALGTISLVAAAAYERLAAQAVDQAIDSLSVESGSKSTRVLLDELRATEAYKDHSRNSEWFDGLFSSLDLSTPSSREILLHFTASFKVSRSIRYPKKGITAQSGAFDILMHLIDLGEKSLHKPSSGGSPDA